MSRYPVKDNACSVLDQDTGILDANDTNAHILTMAASIEEKASVTITEIQIPMNETIRLSL